jgi:branched-chain amino acid transport system substrate-binding protein
VVLPHARRQPSLGDDLLAGLRAGFGALPITLLTEPYDTSPTQARAAVLALLERGAAAIVGLFSYGQAMPLQADLAARRTPLIVADFGADAPRGAAGPWIFRNALNLWQTSHALGAWAATQLGRRTVIVSSFYESGYDLHFAFRQAFEQAGGSVLDAPVTHGPAGNGLADAIARIRAARPDTAFALYSGNEAAEFAAAWRAAGLAGRLPLLGLAPLDAAAPGLLQAATLPWATGLVTPASQRFTRALQAGGRAPGAAALLGYDSGRLLAAAARAGAPHSHAFRAAIATAAFDGPRGPTRVHPVTGHVAAPFYLRTPNGLQRLPPVDEQAAGVAAVPKTGWVQAYLCM